MLSHNTRFAAHRLRSLADLIEMGEIDKALPDLPPLVKWWILDMLRAADPRGLSDAVDDGA